LVSWAEARVGYLNVVVTCAGVIDVSPVESMSLAQWQRVIDVNLTGTFLALRECLPLVRRSSYGRLICIASDAGKTGEAGIAHYCASKFGVIGLAQSMALELIGEPVTVNCVCPVICDTPMMSSLANDFASVIGSGDAHEWRSRFIAEIPAGRACTPADVAHAVSFLASEESSFITGQAINVSGGHEVH
jgi:NAD(P)-dependent dehydrogenase (short-subunit alcohol dehydrogenase family)